MDRPGPSETGFESSDRTSLLGYTTADLALDRARKWDDNTDVIFIDVSIL